MILAKHGALPAARRRRSVIRPWLRHRKIIDLLATDKLRYFAQPCLIIDKY